MVNHVAEDIDWIYSQYKFKYSHEWEFKITIKNLMWAEVHEHNNSCLVIQTVV